MTDLAFPKSLPDFQRLFPGHRGTGIPLTVERGVLAIVPDVTRATS